MKNGNVRRLQYLYENADLNIATKRRNDKLINIFNIVLAIATYEEIKSAHEHSTARMRLVSRVAC